MAEGYFDFVAGAGLPADKLEDFCERQSIMRFANAAARDAALATIKTEGMFAYLKDVHILTMYNSAGAWEEALSSRYAPVSLGRIAEVRAVVDQAGVAAMADLTGLTVTFNAVAGRTYHAMYSYCVAQLTGGGNQTHVINDGAVQLGIIAYRATVNVNVWEMVSGMWPIGALTAGAHTIKLRASVTNGTMSIVNASNCNGRLAVYDVGV